MKYLFLLLLALSSTAYAKQLELKCTDNSDMSTCYYYDDIKKTSHYVKNYPNQWFKEHCYINTTFNQRTFYHNNEHTEGADYYIETDLQPWMDEYFDFPYALDDPKLSSNDYPEFSSRIYTTWKAATAPGQIQDENGTWKSCRPYAVGQDMEKEGTTFSYTAYAREYNILYKDRTEYGFSSRCHWYSTPTIQTVLAWKPRYSGYLRYRISSCYAQDWRPVIEATNEVNSLSFQQLHKYHDGLGTLPSFYYSVQERNRKLEDAFKLLQPVIVDNIKKTNSSSNGDTIVYVDDQITQSYEPIDTTLKAFTEKPTTTTEPSFESLMNVPILKAISNITIERRCAMPNIYDNALASICGFDMTPMSALSLFLWALYSIRVILKA